MADLTSATGTIVQNRGGTVPTVPYPNINSGGVNLYWRHIGAGLFSEWGKIDNYSGANFTTQNTYWTSSQTGSYGLDVYGLNGQVYSDDLPGNGIYGVCVLP